MGVTSNLAVRRKPTRYRPSIDDAYAQIKIHKRLTSAAAALGMSRGSLDRMVSRSSRLSWLVRQLREQIIDLAEEKYEEKILEGNERCILHALNSPLARQRGLGSTPGAEINIDAAPRHTTFKIEILPPTGRTYDPATGRIVEQRMIEHQPEVEGAVVEESEDPEETDDELIARLIG